ncbi:MAG: M28 family metallopeptidase, partial [Anaerolineae bacterium]
MKRFLIYALLLTSCSFGGAIPEARETPTPTLEAVVTPQAAETMPPLPSPTIQSEEVMAALSLDSMMGYLEALTEIEPYSGWRNSATRGEKKAVDYVASVLDSFENLKALGMTVEEEDFKVFMATEIWQADLRITVEGEEYDIPANAPRGPRDDTEIARSFDSDGALTDVEPNPLRREGSIEYISGVNEINSLPAGSAKEVILLVDYALVDRTILNRNEAGRRASLLIQSQPLALVLVTSWSPNPGESHGSFAGDVSAFSWVNDNHTPILVTRLEDYAPSGVTSMEELAWIEKAIVVVDTDVVSPGESRNLVAMIPGRDDMAALIFGAHIDSPNSPGAMDDGSGSAILLEMARVLNETGYQPGVTTYLVWFGSEELGLYGSQTF